MARRIGLLLLLSLCPLSAEIVQLRDGRTMRGRITAQDTETISLRTQDGDYLIYRDQVYRILLDDPAVLRAQEAAEAEKEAKRIAAATWNKHHPNNPVTNKPHKKKK